MFPTKVLKHFAILFFAFPHTLHVRNDYSHHDSLLSIDLIHFSNYSICFPINHASNISMHRFNGINAYITLPIWNRIIYFLEKIMTEKIYTELIYTLNYYLVSHRSQTGSHRNQSAGWFIRLLLGICYSTNPFLAFSPTLL